MIDVVFRRHDRNEGPGTPVHGRPYDEDAEERGETVAPAASGSSEPGPYDAADPAHDVPRSDLGSGEEGPDWTGARHEGGPGVADHGTPPRDRDGLADDAALDRDVRSDDLDLDRDAHPDGPSLDRDTQPDVVGGSRSEHADRLVAGQREPGPVSDVPATAPPVSEPVAADADESPAADVSRGQVDGGERDGVLPDHDRDLSPGTSPGVSPEVADADRREPVVPSPVAAPAAGGADLFGWDADEVRRRWQDVQVAFVDDPRESVERADAMVEEAVSTLSTRRRELVDNWKNAGQGDTERLRLALRDYRSLLERLTGPFQSADRGVK